MEVLVKLALLLGAVMGGAIALLTPEEPSAAAQAAAEELKSLEERDFRECLSEALRPWGDDPTDAEYAQAEAYCR